MPPQRCALCTTNRAQILRPKNHQKLCKSCFIAVFEAEIHHTITSNALFRRGERVAIGASGGKDSTVLASVLKTLNERHDYGVELVLLSIDEGIRGYRDDSLDTVRRNARQYDMPLAVVGYDELYGWTMDQVVAQVGKKGNCTYCGVFRRQALDRGAAMLGVRHVVTGHNADDVAETVLMNLLRGDLPRLSRATSIVTAAPAAAAGPAAHGANVKRSKPLKYAYEKEIVLYAHHKALDYFSTECVYSPEAFRGSARALVKSLERVRPSAILDLVRSGEDMARLAPDADGRCAGACGGKGDAEEAEAEEEEAGCGGASGRTTGGEMAAMERRLAVGERAAWEGLEVEITRDTASGGESRKAASGLASEGMAPVPLMRRRDGPAKGPASTPRKTARQTMGRCARCGYLSSQAVCKACVLLEGLNKSRPRTAIDVADGGEDERGRINGLVKGMDGVAVSAD